MPADPDVTIVVPTRNRHASLRRMVAAIGRQRTDRPFELVVVDDGSTPPVTDADVAAVPARIVRGRGRGAAGARNAGIAAARGAIVLFTDDDTEPDPGWLDTAVRFLAEHPDHVGVEGTVTSTPWDPLYAYSVAVDRPGSYLTCNIAFRRDALARLGGFDEQAFPFHCEDLDLAFRAERIGPIGFAPDMRVLHHARELTLAQAVRRGRMTTNEIALFRRHRARFGRAARLPPPAFPIVSAIHFVVALARSARIDSPRRAGRFAVYAAGYLANVVAGVVRATGRRPIRR